MRATARRTGAQRQRQARRGPRSVDGWAGAVIVRGGVAVGPKAWQHGAGRGQFQGVLRQVRPQEAAIGGVEAAPVAGGHGDVGVQVEAGGMGVGRVAGAAPQSAHPGAAASLREGSDETLTLQALGVTGALYRTRRSTNAIENLNGLVGRFVRNVRRWRDGRMLVRWIAAGLYEARPRLRGHAAAVHSTRSGTFPVLAVCR